MAHRITACDLFCGAGGTSTGLQQACESSGAQLDLTAINHDPMAIETHSANHPGARHLCESLDGVDPRRVCKRLDLLVASPECTHHSNARGGKPRSDQSRATGWHVVRWAEALSPRAILVENVREMLTWGPLDDRGRPLKRRRGETFQAWMQALRSLGYTVEHRILTAADHGDPTTRRRLFVCAVRGRGVVPWPEPTHARKPQQDLFGSLKPWRAAREVIDWSLQGQSIFDRKRPLKDKTLGRIREGLRRFGGEVFLVPGFSERADQRPRTHGTGEPLPTVAAGGHFGLVEPFVMHLTHHGSARVSRVSDPLPTVTGANRGEQALCEPFVIGQQSGAVPRPVSEPLPTLATRGAIGFVEPFLVRYNGTGGPIPVGEPIPTITARDRFGLVDVDGMRLDVRFRMLQPHELALAQGFPVGYRFVGNRTQQVKQIGNAVPVGTARALCLALLGVVRRRVA